MKIGNDRELAITLVAIREYLAAWGIESYEGDRLINAVAEATTQLKRWLRSDEVGTPTDDAAPSLESIERQIAKTMETWDQRMSAVLARFASGLEGNFPTTTKAKKKPAAKKAS